MFVRSVKLYNFRNIEGKELFFSPGLNVIHGRNGQGKTNLVETLNLISSTKSFRSAKTQELIRWGETEASAHVTVEEGLGEIALGVILTKEGKEFLLNGKKSSAIDFVGKLLCVTFSPTDVEIIKGSPVVRRKFLDKHTIDLQPVTLKYLLHYNTAVKNKTLLLKERSPSPQQLDSWDRVLADAATHIMKARAEFVQKLKAVADTYYQRFADSDGHMSLSLKSNISLDDTSSAGIFDFVRSKRSEELQQRSALYGPHRDDLQITVNSKSSRLYASQGQSKSLAIALKLGVIDLLEGYRGESPVIILDDVDAELDSDRLKKLYEIIIADKRQVFITGTEVNKSLEGYPSDYSAFFVQNGAIDTEAVGGKGV